MPITLLESCVESLDEAIAAERAGAGRIELCANLDVGGTTPGADLIALVARRTIPVFVMVRPRGGNFVYDAGELRAMEQDIRLARASGARGVVFGALDRDGRIDRMAMHRLVETARPLSVTCHRAIDDTPDLSEALDTLLTLGIERVLTSGGAPTATAGADTIARLVAQAGEALVVMAGGTVRAHTVADLIRRTGVREVHARWTGPELYEVIRARPI